MVKINELIGEEDMDGLQECLLNKHLALSAVDPSNIAYYQAGLRERLQRKREEVGTSMYICMVSFLLTMQLLFMVDILSTCYHADISDEMIKQRLHAHSSKFH